MNCKKSEKVVRRGVQAGKCRNLLAVLLLCVTVLIPVAGNLSGCARTEPGSDVEETVVFVETKQENAADSLPEEPKDGDVLENSDYSDGTPRRRVFDYGDLYITDYRPDGTTLRDTILYYSSGTYGGIRVTNCDDFGNPTDETETMADGSLWMYLYYENSYDDAGRPVRLAQYNRVGNPLMIRTYTYNADGSWRMDFEEYSGAVYEYDFEENPAGETSLWNYGYTTFDAEGNVIDQMIESVF